MKKTLGPPEKIFVAHHLQTIVKGKENAINDCGTKILCAARYSPEARDKSKKKTIKKIKKPIKQTKTTMVIINLHADLVSLQHFDMMAPYKSSPRSGYCGGLLRQWRYHV